MLKVTETHDEGPGNCRRNKHIAGATEQEKASQLSRTPLGPKPIRAKILETEER